jgi:hypothetical protein
MAGALIEKLLKRYKKSKAVMDIYRDIFEDVFEYVMPFYNTFAGAGAGGGDNLNRNSKQYDSTAMISSVNFVNNLVSNLTPSFVRWANIKSGPMVAEKNRSALDKDLENLTRLEFTYLNSSNFYTALPSFYFNLGIGMGALLVDEGHSLHPLSFTTIPFSSIAVEEGIGGEIHGVYITEKIKGELIKHKFRDARMDVETERAIADNPDRKFTLVQAFSYDYVDLDWKRTVFIEETKASIYESRSRYCPVITPRWMRIAGVPVGVGPFILGRSDYKMLNKLKELQARKAMLDVFGVYTVANDGVVNVDNIKLSPLAFIPVASNGGPAGPSIAPLASGGNFQMQQYMIEGLQDSVRQSFADNNMPPESSAVRSVFELVERLKKFAYNLGAAYSGLMYEYVQPLFRRITEILQNKGLVTLPDYFEIDSLFVMIQVTSPVAQQQSIEDLSKISQAIQFFQGYDPAMLRFYKNKEIFNRVNEMLGISADVRMSDDEMDAMIGRENAAAAMQAQSQLAAAAQEGANG